MKILKLLTIVLIVIGLTSCCKDNKPSDPVQPPTPTPVQPTPVPPPPPSPIVKDKTVTVYFHFNSAKLTSAQKKVIQQELSARKDGSQVTIVGYTDSQGSKKYNQKLSERRAKAVSKYLNSLKITNSWTAKGESDLVNADKTIAEHKLNRRSTVEFTVIVK